MPRMILPRTESGIVSIPRLIPHGGLVVLLRLVNNTRHDPRSVIEQSM